MTYTPHHPLAPVPDRCFTPVPVRARHDGWTPERQIEFIEALAACGCVTDAAARVGMSSQSAYTLRLREEAESFREAWDAALTVAVRLLSEGAFSRAVYGVAVPHYYRGEKIGESRRFNEPLTQFLLKHLDPGTYMPGLIFNRRDLDEERVAAVDIAVSGIRDAADAEVTRGEPDGRPGDAVAQPERAAPPVPEAATRSAADGTIDGTPRDEADRTERAAFRGDGSPSSQTLSSQTFERWGDENYPAGDAIDGAASADTRDILDVDDGGGATHAAVDAAAAGRTPQGGISATSDRRRVPVPPRSASGSEPLGRVQPAHLSDAQRRKSAVPDRFAAVRAVVPPDQALIRTAGGYPERLE